MKKMKYVYEISLRKIIAFPSHRLQKKKGHDYFRFMVVWFLRMGLLGC